MLRFFFNQEQVTVLQLGVLLECKAVFLMSITQHLLLLLLNTLAPGLNKGAAS